MVCLDVAACFQFNSSRRDHFAASFSTLYVMEAYFSTIVIFQVN